MRALYTAILTLSLALPWGLGCGDASTNILVGDWIQNSGNSWSFHADGTFQETKTITHTHGDTGEIHMHPITTSGTYAVVEDNLRLSTQTDATGTRQLTRPFYLTADALYLDVLTPEGALQGVIGSWISRQSDIELREGQLTQSFTSERRLQLREDGTAIETISPPDPALEVDYRYVSSGADAYKLIDAQGIEEQLTEVNGAVLNRFGSANAYSRAP